MRPLYVLHAFLVVKVPARLEDCCLISHGDLFINTRRLLPSPFAHRINCGIHTTPMSNVKIFSVCVADFPMLFIFVSCHYGIDQF